MHLHRCKSAGAIYTLERTFALPSGLSLNTINAVKAIALGTFQRVRLDNELAKTTQEEVYCVLQRALNIYLI